MKRNTLKHKDMFLGKGSRPYKAHWCDSVINYKSAREHYGWATVRDFLILSSVVLKKR